MTESNRQRWARYLEGTLPPAEIDALRDALRQAPPMREAAMRDAEVHGMLDALGRCQDPDDGFLHQLLARLPAELASERVVPPPIATEALIAAEPPGGSAPLDAAEPPIATELPGAVEPPVAPPPVAASSGPSVPAPPPALATPSAGHALPPQVSPVAFSLPARRGRPGGGGVSRVSYGVLTAAAVLLILLGTGAYLLTSFGRRPQVVQQPPGTDPDFATRSGSENAITQEMPKRKSGRSEREFSPRVAPELPRVPSGSPPLVEPPPTHPSAANPPAADLASSPQQRTSDGAPVFAPPSRSSTELAGGPPSAPPATAEHSTAGESEIVHVGRLTAEKDAVWERRPESAYLARVPLRLVAGSAEITLDQGAVILLHGPAVFQANSANQLTLSQGRLTAHVPPAAVGFTVRTPSSRIVDLGTRFDVQVDKTGTSQVHVLQGAVEFSPPERASATWDVCRLSAGDFQGASGDGQRFDWRAGMAMQWPGRGHLSLNGTTWSFNGSREFAEAARNFRTRLLELQKQLARKARQSPTPALSGLVQWNGRDVRYEGERGYRAARAELLAQLSSIEGLLETLDALPAPLRQGVAPPDFGNPDFGNFPDLLDKQRELLERLRNGGPVPKPDFPPP